MIAVGEFSSLLVGDFVLLVHMYAKQSKVDWLPHLREVFLIACPRAEVMR